MGPFVPRRSSKQPSVAQLVRAWGLDRGIWHSVSRFARPWWSPETSRGRGSTIAVNSSAWAVINPISRILHKNYSVLGYTFLRTSHRPRYLGLKGSPIEVLKVFYYHLSKSIIDLVIDYPGVHPWCLVSSEAARLHAHRAARRHRDHRRLDRPFAARRPVPLARPPAAPSAPTTSSNSPWPPTTTSRATAATPAAPTRITTAGRRLEVFKRSRRLRFPREFQRLRPDAAVHRAGAHVQLGELRPDLR